MMNLRNINYRFVGRILGIMCISESFMIFIAVAIAYYYSENLSPFLYTIFIGLAIGVILIELSGKDYNKKVGKREGMIAVSFTWILLSSIAMLPFIYSSVTTSIIDSFFETVSGFTTTGVTIFKDVEKLPKSILFWRSLLQWQGGIGIVVFTVSLAPMLGNSASKLYFEETTGITQDRFLPQIKDVAIRMCIVYILETLALIILLWLGPMGLFDSICQSFATLATGGFSTKNNSVASFNSAYSEYVISIFMYIGGVNLTLVYFIFTGKPKHLFENEELKWYTFILVFMCIITTVWLIHLNKYPTIELTFRKALFNVFSLGTSTGFGTADVTFWGPFFWMIALFLMFVNACAGSTAGGLKMSRFAILIKNIFNEFKKITHPNLVVPVIFNRKQLSISVVHQILAFSILYTLIVFIGSTLLMVDGNGFIESISASITCISNSGISIGKYASNYAMASTFDKVILSFVMITGRLEIFTIITIFTSYFWKK